MIKEIRVGAAKTINLGNYQSLRIEAGITVEVADGDDLELVKRSAQQELRSLLEQTWHAQRKENT